MGLSKRKKSGLIPSDRMDGSFSFFPFISILLMRNREATFVEQRINSDLDVCCLRFLWDK